jgi:RNA-directed DNA polymerase
MSEIIENYKFLINEKKTSLHFSSSRHLVTGLVVNQGVTVPREYIRSLRAILHSWETKGLELTEERFFSRHYAKTIFTQKQEGSSFEEIIIGRTRHIGNINGWDSPQYLRLASQLMRVSKRFKINKNKSYTKKQRVIILCTEGKTDQYHLETALQNFQLAGRYQDLEIKYIRSPSGEGEDSLLKALQNHSNVDQKHVLICLFDRDVEKTLRQVESPASGYVSWGNRVYSCAIPKISSRTKEDICIEYYYSDEELRREDSSGRRFFFKDEFNDEGVSKCGGFIYSYPKSKSHFISKGEIFRVGTNEPNLLLSKAAFALSIKDKIKPFDSMCFDNFSLIFDKIVEIQDLDLQSVQSLKKKNTQPDKPRPKRGK